MKTIERLIDDLKEATEGSRDLDSAIAFVTMKRHESIYHNEGNGRVTEYGPKNKTNLIAKELSTNLDKISKYMEALLPNSCFRSGKSFKYRDKFVCNILINFYNKDGASDSDEGVALPTIIATANTEALSRCLALVMAYDKGYVTYGDNYKVEGAFVPYGKSYG